MGNRHDTRARTVALSIAAVLALSLGSGTALAQQSPGAAPQGGPGVTGQAQGNQPGAAVGPSGQAPAGPGVSPSAVGRGAVTAPAGQTRPIQLPRTGDGSMSTDAPPASLWLALAGALSLGAGLTFRARTARREAHRPA